MSRVMLASGHEHQYGEMGLEMNGYRDLALYLKKKRVAAGLSQAEVSEKLGYSSPQFVSNWERGLAKPPLFAMSKLMKLYSANAEEVLDQYISATEQKLKKALFQTVKARKK